MIKDIELISYHRTGGNFFIQKFTYDTGMAIAYRHDITSDANTLVNIVRHPLDSIISMNSMDETINAGKRREYLKYTINDYIPHYIRMYNFLFNTDKRVIFIKYEDLNNPNLFHKVYEILNIQQINREKDNFDFLEIASKINLYQVTSKNNDNYQEVKDILTKVDLSECLDIYHQALSKCIKI